LIASTSWPISSEAVEHLLLRALEALASPGSRQPGANAEPPALELARRWQGCDPVRQEGCWSSLEPTAKQLRSTSAQPLVATVLGEHAPFSNDIAQSLEVAAGELGVMLRFVNAGQYYLCQGFASGCEEDAVKSWMRSWLGRWEQIEASGDDATSEADGLFAALHAHPEPRAAEPDLFVCGDSAVFCWLLRRRASARARVSRFPAFHMLGMVLLQYVPRPWHAEMAADFREWWLAHDESVDQFAVFMEALGLQMQWQMGVLLPFVPSLGPAAHSTVSYNPPDRGRHASVLVLKSTFWRLPAGRVFATVLERFMSHLSSPVSFNGLSPGLSGDSGAWQSFESMSRHLCALFVPAELSQIKFRDMYFIGLPMLVPDDAWLLRVLRHMFVAWGQLHAEHAHGRLQPRPSAGSQPAVEPAAVRTRTMERVTAAADAWPHAPFYDPTRDRLARLAYWLPLADVKRYPHVVQFSSLGDLLGLIGSTDWAAVSAGMRVHSVRIVAGNVQRYYRQSLASLLSGGTAASARGAVEPGPSTGW